MCHVEYNLRNVRNAEKAIAATRVTYSKFKRVEAYCIIHNVVVNMHLSLRVPLYLSVTHVA